MAALTNEQILQVVQYLADNGIKITELGEADAATGTELFEVVQSGVSKKMTAAQIVLLAAGQVVAAGFQAKNNTDAVAAPLVGNDITQGYSVGSIWIYAGAVSVCTDATVGAAVWVAVSQPTSGTWIPTVVSEDGGVLEYPYGAFTWMKVGNIVSFWGRFQVSAMASGTSVYQGLLSLPAEALPNNNWDDVIYINGPVVQIGVLSGTASFEVLSYDGGGKEMFINITKDSADTSYYIYISASYSVDN